MTDEDFDLLVAHNCAGECGCDECKRIKALPTEPFDPARMPYGPDGCP